VEIQAEVRTACAGLSPRHAARFQSTCGQHAGSWLAVFPMSGWATARARHYQLGLVARLGLPMVEFMPIAGLSRLCRFCRAALDVHGWHAGLCGKGNTESLWTRRHDVVQMALLIVSRRYGYTAVDCSTGSGSWFGSAGLRPGSTRSRAADIVYPHYFGPGHHLFLDIAVADPGTGAALSATPSSATTSGVAAELRAAKKVAKYDPLATVVGSAFRAAVVERYGSMCDSLVGHIRMLCGDRDRDPLQVDDYSFAASSRATYMASMLCFAAVMGDACMVERAMQLSEVQGAAGRPAASMPPARRAGSGGRGGHGQSAGGQHGGWGEVPYGDVVSMGGQLWYEAC
jgi:hypothetical protein